LEHAPGGHLGVLTGRSAKRTTWRYIDEFFVEHGGAVSASVLAAA
jgi:polyhydroxyalkanoate synthase